MTKILLLMFLAAPLSATGCIAAVDSADQSEAQDQASDSLSTCAGEGCRPQIVLPTMRRDPVCVQCVASAVEFARDPAPMVQARATAAFPPAAVLKPFLVTR